MLLMIRLLLLVFFIPSYLGSVHSLAEIEPSADCPPFDCGKLGSIQFPFTTHKRHPHCGLLVIDGCDTEIQTIQLERGGRPYPIFSISSGDAIFIHDEDFLQNLSSESCEIFNNLTFPSSPFLSFHLTRNATLLKCDPSVDVPSLLDPVNCTNFCIFYDTEPGNQSNLPSQCTPIQLPVQTTLSISDVYNLLSADFSLKVIVSPDCEKCHYDRQGECSVSGMGEFSCLKPRKASVAGDRKLGPLLPIVGSVAAGVAVALISLCYFRRHVSYHNNVIICWSKETNDYKSIESFLRSQGLLMQKIFSYSQIKKMTRSFRDKLGQGGYGSVFKGRLPGGRLVAVKVLKESRTNGEEFINEVASISRTSHVNIVTLLGFCVEGSKRALIYEFMSNGSLEKYIHQDSSLVDCKLGWETLYQIAIGIARGLEYLHRGCNTRILHFDIKPHNILLDENFCPKISDFGLAKICLQRESIISMSVARGTVGYIAPELFCRNFGRVSHKSDVYSYGMMVLEMIGGRRNISTEVENTSEIYFPDWIHKNLESGEELELPQIRNEDENQLARRMIIVSLWCIQTMPSDRPPMSRVIEMLQGSIQPLLIPPSPCLSSAPSSPPRLETNSPDRPVYIWRKGAFKDLIGKLEPSLEMEINLGAIGIATDRGTAQHCQPGTEPL